MLDLVDQVIGLQDGYSLNVISHGLEKMEKNELVLQLCKIQRNEFICWKSQSADTHNSGRC